MPLICQHNALLFDEIPQGTIRSYYSIECDTSEIHININNYKELCQNRLIKFNNTGFILFNTSFIFSNRCKMTSKCHPGPSHGTEMIFMKGSFEN